MIRSLVCMLLVVLAAGCAAPRRFVYGRMIMAVEARITIFAEDPATARDAAAAAFARMDALEDVMSDYRPGSELRGLEARAGGGPQPTSADLVAVLARSKALAEATGGAFDPAIGALTRRWRAARRTGVPPGEAELDAARAVSGHHRLRVDAAAGTVTLDAGTRLDLGGIGKGFAAQEAVRVLREWGAPRCLVDLGGDIVAGAPPPGRDGWTVALATLDGAAASIDLAHAAVAVSGDTEQFLESGGVRHSHVLDPRTGRAVTVRRMVTVVAPDGATADALASALSVDGAGGRAWLDRFEGVEARVVEVRDGVVDVVLDSVGGR